MMTSSPTIQEISRNSFCALVIFTLIYTATLDGTCRVKKDMFLENKCTGTCASEVHFGQGLHKVQNVAGALKYV